MAVLFPTRRRQQATVDEVGLHWIPILVTCLHAVDGLGANVEAAHLGNLGVIWDPPPSLWQGHRRALCNVARPEIDGAKTFAKPPAEALGPVAVVPEVQEDIEIFEALDPVDLLSILLPVVYALLGVGPQ